SMHTITLEEAIDLFRLPRKLGEHKGEEVSVGIGRFGPFAKRGSTYASLKKEDDPYTVDLDRAVFLIEEKEEIARTASSRSSRAATSRSSTAATAPTSATAASTAASPRTANRPR